MAFIVSVIKRHILFILFISFLSLLIFFTFKDYGVPWDEKVYFNTGKYFAVKIFNFLHVPTNLSTSGFEPTSYHLRGHGVFMDILTVFSGLPFSNFNFETLHLIRALFALPIFFLLYWIVSKLTSKVYGLISVIFLLLIPRFYPEIFYNAVDIPTALLFTICLAYFIYYAQTKHTALKSILFGFILGITINQRLLLFYLPILNFLFLFFLQKNNLKKFILHQFLIFNFSLLTMHLTHPYLLTNPITGLFEIISHAKQYPWNAAVLFDSQFYQAGIKPLPWYYLPKTMLFTIPLSVILLFIFGNLRLLFIFFNQVLYWYRSINNVNQKAQHMTNLVRSHQNGNKYLISNIRYLNFYFLCVFYIPFLLIFILRPTLYDSWRQFLFLTVPMIIIAMFGLTWLFNLKFANWKLRFVWKLVIGTWIFISLGFTMVKMINLHPLEYLYYNSLVGALKGAYGKYETDYWGLGYKESTIWFNKNVNDPKKQYKLFVEGDPLSSSYYFKPNMRLTLDVNQADYIFTFTRWNFHLRHPGKTIYTVEREGVPLIFVKKL